MIYCDTSLLVAVLTPEVHSDVARRWYFAQPHGSTLFSDWSVTEVASALALKQRRGVLNDVIRMRVETAWAALRAEMMHIAVKPVHFASAAALVDKPPSGLRSGDALHLAILLDQGCHLATFDRDLASAARAMGVVVHPDG